MSNRTQRRAGELALLSGVGLGAIALTIVANIALTEGRAAAAFAQPIAYARSFFARDSLVSYGPESESPGARFFAIQFDADTGETRVDSFHLQTGPAPALRPEVIRAAAQDVSAAGAVAAGTPIAGAVRVSSPVPSRAPVTPTPAPPSR